MKKWAKRCGALALVLAMGLMASACSVDDLVDVDELDYGNYPTANKDSDSWLQIDPDDEDVEITWWIDATSWDFYQISSLIYKRTGVKVKFQRALKSDGTELSTMISNNNLPDVITITDYSTRSQLAAEGYVYPIDKLAELYAPTLLDRIDENYSNYFAADDGHIYGYMNNYFADSDLEEFSENGGHIRPLYSIVVREDYLNAYLDYKVSQDSSYDREAVMTGNQFIEMCVWVKEHFNLPNSNPTVTLSDFPLKADKQNVNSSLTAIMEYFCVPREDAQGNLLYQYEQKEFLEVLNFLNSLYNNKLILSNNFSYKSSDIITNIKNGLPFAVIGRNENYITGYAPYSANGYDAAAGKTNPSHEYVSIVITNEKGDAPLIVDKSGRGLRYSMITNRCKRIDRVIKVFDYLISEQGNRESYYGLPENGYYEFVVNPGESETVTENGQPVTKTYKYGKIAWTDKAKALLGAQSGSGWYNAGIKQISLLCNPMYAEMTSVNGAAVETYQWYKCWDMLCGLIPYTYSKTVWDFEADASDPKYNKMANVQSDIEEIWIRYLPTIIMAPKSEVESLWNTVLQKCNKKGLGEWKEFRNKYYKEYKEKMGIEYGWPAADPEYAPPALSLRGAYDEYRKEMPDYFHFN